MPIAEIAIVVVLIGIAVLMMQPPRRARMARGDLTARDLEMASRGEDPVAFRESAARMHGRAYGNIEQGHMEKIHKSYAERAAINSGRYDPHSPHLGRHTMAMRGDTKASQLVHSHKRDGKKVRAYRRKPPKVA